MTKKDLGLMVLVVAILVKLNFFPDTDPLPYGADPDRAMWNVNSDIVAPHSLIQRWLALLYYCTICGSPPCIKLCGTTIHTNFRAGL